MIDGNKLLTEYSKKGYFYSKDTLFNYYVSMLTKPFVILTGISGSGKSKIAEVFAEIIAEEGEKNFELIPVKPNWRDNKGLFGYHNVIDDSYYITPLIKLFIKALSNPEKPYFLILDEMNIAQVEHYFSDYLSLIESRRLVESDEADIVFDDFVFPDDIKLSEALILAAIDINKPDEELEIRAYRENRFTETWKKQNFHGKDDSWTPQVRTELNQKDSAGNPSRLAGRVFTGGDGKYKLKEKSELSPEDAAIIDKLEKMYNSLVKRKFGIHQDNIVLHNSEKCLSAMGGKACNCDNCPFAVNEKYKCDKLYSESEGLLVPSEMPIPLNVFTIGTVNVDETTYMFSPKVLDRANVIEFNEIDLGGVYNLTDEMRRMLSYSRLLFDTNYFFDNDKDLSASLKIGIPSINDVNAIIDENPDEYTDLLRIFNSLKKYNMQFGYRVMNEICSYLINAKKMSGKKDCIVHALDLQFLQKILPKFHGSYEKLWNPLVEIFRNCLSDAMELPSNLTDVEINDFLSQKLGKDVVFSELTVADAKIVFKYPNTGMKVVDMMSDLDSQGFATFIR